jgi:hypothetical protein
MTCPHVPFAICISIGVQQIGEERLALANCPCCGTTLARRLCSVPDCQEHGAHEVDPDEGEAYCDLHAAALVLMQMRARGQAPRREVHGGE